MTTTSLTALADAGVAFAKLTKRNTYASRRTKADATHRIETAPGSVLATPLRKPRKNRKFTPVPRYSHITQEAMNNTIPAGATHLSYTTAGGRTEVIADARFAGDFDGMRGKLRYGIYHPARDSFESLMPEDKADPYLEDRDPAPIRCPITEHRSMRNTAPAAPAAPSAPAAPKAPRAPRAPSEPGVAPARPAAGSKTAQVWEAADALAQELGREPAKAELVAKLPGHNPSTISVQFSAWRKARHQAA